MTEKRFEADKYNFEIWENGDVLLSFDQTVDLLNQLNDENEHLQKEVKSKQRVINAYEQYINDLKEDGVIE